MRRDRLEQKVLTYIREQNMLAPGEKVLLAVSGGSDSTALLAVISALAPELGITIGVVHLDHSLRPSSWQEAELVEEHCHRFEVPLYTRTTDVRSYCRERRVGLEAGAREVRHQWIKEAAILFGAGHIATAHHRDDQAETVLLHLLRGTGLKGLGGMEPAGKDYIRPLLSCGKEELVNYLKHRGISFLEDESNLDVTYLRNRVRHQLLPLLEADYNPAIRERLFMLGELARQDYEFISTAAVKVSNRAVRKVDAECWGIDIAVWEKEPAAIRSQIIMQILAQVRGTEDFTKHDIEAIINLAKSPGSAKMVKLSGQVTVTREYGFLYLRSHKKPSGLKSFSYQLTIPGRTVITERKMIITAGYQLPSAAADGQAIALNASVCPVYLVVRSRCRGDRISLPGGTKKISDWMVDHKIPFRERASQMLLANGQEIVWIEGGPVAVTYQPQSGKDRVWITIEPQK
ncbi:MAG: tRNA lysidine(34) synthetase TilS [Methylocystaceae bacterium]